MDQATLEFWQTIVVILINLIVPVILGVFLAWIRPLLKQWEQKAVEEMGAANWEFTKNLVEQFVQAAEQQGLVDTALKTGENKKNWVIAQMNAYSKDNGFAFDWNLVYNAIESAVWSTINDNGNGTKK